MSFQSLAVLNIDCEQATPHFPRIPVQLPPPGRQDVDLDCPTGKRHGNLRWPASASNLPAMVRKLMLPAESAIPASKGRPELLGRASFANGELLRSTCLAAARTKPSDGYFPPSTKHRAESSASSSPAPSAGKRATARQALAARWPHADGSACAVANWRCA